MSISSSCAAAAAGAASCLLFVHSAGAQTDTGSTIPEIVVTSQRLDEGRSHIQTQTGASSYTIDSAAIANTPGGDNTLLNQVILQAPDVVQDSFGQFHIRGEHNGLQYRLNGIILPEGIAVFGQSLDPRFISSLSLVTGALPAEYGLRTAGIIDITTRNGLQAPGGSVALYGGSHGEVQPSFSYGGGGGSLSYLLTGDQKYLQPYQSARDRKRNVADGLDRNPLGDGLAAVHERETVRDLIVRRIELRLDADHFDRRIERLRRDRDPRDQAAAADRHEQYVEVRHVV